MRLTIKYQIKTIFNDGINKMKTLQNSKGDGIKVIFYFAYKSYI